MLGIYLALGFSDLSQKLIAKAEEGLAILTIIAVAMVSAISLADTSE
jgi:hypothetical protein